MPTGTCKFPEHHGPSAGPPAGLVVAMLLAALVLIEWHTVLLVLVCALVVGLVAAGMVVLWHAQHEPGYDVAWPRPELPAAAALPAGQEDAWTAEVVQEDASNAHARTGAITPEAASLVAELHAALAAGRPAIVAPQQHLHIHLADNRDDVPLWLHQAIEAADRRRHEED